MCNMEINLQLLLEVASLKIRSPKPGRTMSAYLLAGLHVEGNGFIPGSPRNLQESPRLTLHSLGPRERRKPSPPQWKACVLSCPRHPFLSGLLPGPVGVV